MAMRANGLGMISAAGRPPPRALEQVTIETPSVTEPTAGRFAVLMLPIRRVREHRAVRGYWSCCGPMSVLSLLSILSLMSLFSFLSVLSFASVTSAGSAFSANSVASLFSVNSVASIGCYNEYMKICVSWFD